jgi:hypothetical protein
VLLACANSRSILCFSTLNGYCFGSLNLDTPVPGVFPGSLYHEIEGVAVQSLVISGRPTVVHVMNEGEESYIPPHNADYALHSYSVPRPDEL